MQYRAYGFIQTYRTAQNDMFGRTIFEMLHDQLTFSIQVATRRGVTREIDNWATSGISWYFKQYTNVDKLTAMRFDLIAEIANQTGHWPAFIFAYFPACDKVGHRFGMGSTEYRQAIRNVDEQIGRICRGLERAGVLDSTLLVLTTDHGQAPMRDGDGVVDVAEYLAKHFGMRATDKRLHKPDYVDRYDFYDRYDVVAVPDAPRLLGLHLRGAGLHWYDRPKDMRPLELSTRDGRITGEQLAEHLAQRPYSRFCGHAGRAGHDPAGQPARQGLGAQGGPPHDHAAERSWPSGGVHRLPGGAGRRSVGFGPGGQRRKRRTCRPGLAGQPMAGENNRQPESGGSFTDRQLLRLGA